MESFLRSLLRIQQEGPLAIVSSQFSENPFIFMIVLWRRPIASYQDGVEVMRMMTMSIIPKPKGLILLVNSIYFFFLQLVPRRKWLKKTGSPIVDCLLYCHQLYTWQFTDIIRTEIEVC